ncbi:FecR domain-containing protein [Sphingobacterium sp. E70]|uniref:FecR domain-containing protein n=1 Tax=Sphingobacterium sp. E70 TaxID=2853439 RepID=UPI00359C317C
MKYTDGSLIQSAVPNTDLIATVNTAAGSMLQITLADGSQVTLNAKTSFKYPYNSQKTRDLWKWMEKPTLKSPKIKKCPSV